METVKKIIVGFLGVIATLMIVSIYLPSKVVVEKKVVIDANKELAYEQISNLNNWPKWSVCLRSEQYAVNSTNDTVLNWTTTEEFFKKQGSFVVAEANPNQLVKIVVEKNQKKTSTSTFQLTEKADSVLIEWNLVMELGKSPINRFKGLFLQKPVGIKMGNSLDQLKISIENLK